MYSNLIKLEKKINIKFKNSKLLIQSLTHKSYDTLNNNEKLEFLGDRVLGLVLSKKLLEIYPDEREGVLDKKLASLVNRKRCFDVAKSLSLDKFIFSLGIRHIGQENARLLSKYFLDIDNFKGLTKNFNFNSLSNIDGIGETQILSLKNFFTDQINLNVVGKLISILNIKNVVLNKKGKLKNKTFMFTGKLINISRAEAKSLTEENSGKILSNVSQKLDYLVIEKNPLQRKSNKQKN